MELFKTSSSIQAWHYPEEYIFGINNVPLFAGFMYSAVGSYIARAWRIFDFDFIHYPKIEYSMILSIFIYINFFSHHYIYDLRWILLIVTILLFYKTYVNSEHTKIYILPIWFFIAFIIWIAENIATYANIWLYPNQEKAWQMVSFQKILSWYLLMILSFVLISIIKLIKESSIYENYLKFASLTYMAIILVFIANLNLGIINNHTLYFLKFIPHADYIARVVIFFIFTLSLNSLLRFKPISILELNLSLGTIFTILFATIEEFSQLYLINRYFDILDILFSYAGIIVAHIATKERKYGGGDGNTKENQTHHIIKT